MSSPDPVRKLTYTPGEVAAMVGTSEWWVREQIRRRRVPHVRLGQRRLALREQDIPALLEIFAVDVVPEPEDTTTPRREGSAVVRPCRDRPERAVPGTPSAVQGAQPV